MLPRPLLWCITATTAASLLAGSPPSADHACSVSLSGVPLRTASERLSRDFGVRLGVSPELSSQRVTVYAPAIELSDLTEALTALLSTEPNGKVFWEQRAERHWVLQQSPGRRQLIERLREGDQALFVQHVAREVEWLGARAEQELAAAPDGPRRVLLQQRVALAGLMQELDREGQVALLSGQPISRSIGEMPGRCPERFRDWLSGMNPGLGRLMPRELDRYHLVFCRERSPSDPHAGGISFSLVSPKGLVQMRGTLLRPRAGPAAPPENPEKKPPTERPVTVRLIRDEKLPPGVPAAWTLDDLLQQLSEQLKLPIIADGYLRPSISLPNELRAEDMPLDEILNRLTGLWNCDWRWLNRKKDAVLVRARYWWLEDAADVPDQKLEELRKLFEPGSAVHPVDALAEVAQLSDAQIRKLIETGRCKQASGIVQRGIYDGVGASAVLRFYSTLTPQQKARATSTEGLRLRDTEPLLRARLLGPTLLAWVGAITPEYADDLILRIQPGTGPGAGSGYLISIRSSRRFGCHWEQFIGVTTDGGRGGAAQR